jgi:hypothetical protein
MLLLLHHSDNRNTSRKDAKRLGLEHPLNKYARYDDRRHASSDDLSGSNSVLSALGPVTRASGPLEWVLPRYTPH